MRCVLINESAGGRREIENIRWKIVPKITILSMETMEQMCSFQKHRQFTFMQTFANVTRACARSRVFANWNWKSFNVESEKSVCRYINCNVSLLCWNADNKHYYILRELHRSRGKEAVAAAVAAAATQMKIMAQQIFKYLVFNSCKHVCLYTEIHFATHKCFDSYGRYLSRSVAVKLIACVS